MFYAHFVLSKKGPLARIWLAAHWDKKLTRSQVFETNITSSVEAILEPKVKLALRTSGHLLLGVVRIHSRQAKYLLSDCNEAFVKIKMAFRPGADLTEDSHRDNTALAAITLSDNIHDFESTLADINDMDPFGIAVNQSRPEDITMREEFGEPNLGRPDDDFGDSTFEDGADRDFVGESINIDAMEDHNEQEITTLTQELVKNHRQLDRLDHHDRIDSDDRDDRDPHGFPEMPPSVGGLGANTDSEFGDVMDVDYGVDSESVENMETMFRDDTNIGQTATSAMELGGEGRTSVDDASSVVDSRLLLRDTSVTSAIAGANSVTMGTSLAPVVEHNEEDHDISITASGIDTNVPPVTVSNKKHNDKFPQNAALSISPSNNQPARINLPDFAVPPVDRSQRENRRAPKRKRKLLIDEHKSIPSDVMKMQMQDTSEITTRLDLAPPTRKLMLWKETGNVEALFTSPGRAIPSRILQKLFYRNMKTISVPNDAQDGLPIIPGNMRRCLAGGFLLDGDENDDNNNNNDETEINNNVDINIDDSNTDKNLNIDPLGTNNSINIGISKWGDSTGRHELCNISEVPELPDGACSSYSTNYDCWSGHATPHRDDDDDNNIPTTTAAVTDTDITINNLLPQSVSAKSPPDSSAYINLHNNSAGFANSSRISGQPIEKMRSYNSSDFSFANSNYTGSNDDSSLNKSILDQTICPGDPSVHSQQHNIDFDIVSDIADSVSNKLQTTMVMLDQQLDKVNEEYPVEITQEGLEKRSDIMLNVLRSAINREGQVDFHHLTVSNNKKQAASKFYTLLLLGKQRKLQMYQETPYSNIIITRVESD